MVDQFDRAQELDACFLRQALDMQARAARAGSGASREFCIDCEEEIPQARRRAAPGCLRCVGCAEEYEREGKKK